MRVHYERAGSGPSLLLLHGIGSNSRSFRQQLAGLADAFSVVAWDAPGYGRSEDPLEPPTMEAFADRAAELLDELAISQTAVLGVSFGGVVAQVLYRYHPERVGALILADTNTGGGALPEPERTARVRQRLQTIERLGPRGMAAERASRLLSRAAPRELVAELTDIMAEVRPAGYRAAAIALGNTNTSAWLGDVTVPTLVIHGAEDAIVLPGTGRALAEAIPGARFVELPDAGHASNQEQPAAFNAAVRSFLAGC